MSQTLHSVRIKTLFLERDKYENYPVFQRERVWSNTMKRSLVDTALRDMYMHPLLVYERVSEEGVLKYFLIDGQQRLSTLLEFMDGKFATTSAAMHRKEELSSLPPVEPNRYYAQLSPTVRNAFDDYLLNFYVLKQIDDPTVGLTFRRVQNQVPLTMAEKLWSYTSHTTAFAVDLSRYPLWTNWYQGSTHRRQSFQGSLYPIYLELTRGFANMTYPRLRDLAAGAKDKDLTDEVKQAIRNRLEIVLHVFAGTPFTLKEEIVPMYQAVLLLEGRGITFKPSDKGCLTPWMATIQSQGRGRKGIASIFSTLLYTNVQREFWEAHLPQVLRQYREYNEEETLSE